MWADSSMTWNLRSLLVAYLDDMFKLFNAAGLDFIDKDSLGIFPRQSKGCDFFSSQRVL